MAHARPLHIVYVLRECPDSWRASLLDEVRALEALGHRVTVFSRLGRYRRGVHATFSTIRGRVRLIREDDPLIHLKAVLSHLRILLSSPLRYRRIIRSARIYSPRVTARRFLHAGMLACAARRIGADHLHFVSRNSRIARFVASLSGLSYSITSYAAKGSAPTRSGRYVVAGANADPKAVELLIRIMEGPWTRETALALVVDCPRSLRETLVEKLDLEGLEVHETTSLGTSPDLLLERPPDIVLAGAGVDGAGAFRLLKRLREDLALRHVPFVLLTDLDDRRLRREAFRRGADDCFLCGHEVDELIARALNALRRRSGRPGERLGRRRRGITGQLENLPLPEIVQVLVLGAKTACVTLSSRDGEGRIWFRRGRLVHAKLGPSEGADAFYELLRWKDGEFTIEYSVDTYKKTIEGDAMFLVFEGLRRADEQALTAS